MTTIDVQPSIYYTAASALHTSAVNLYNAFNGRADALDGCASMAGSYDEAKSWAAGYDANAHQALDSMFTLAETMDAYAGALRTIGYNHQLADWNATTGDKGPAPVKPADPLPAVLSCRKPAPSAGGPGNGLSDAIHLAEKVGITIPDGDLDKLAAIAGTWAALQNDRAIGALADGIGRVISSVSLVKSPEAAQVVEDLQGMKLSASTIAGACGEIATSCQTHHDDLHRLREQLQKKLEELAKELIEQVGVTLILGAVANCLTAGLATVVTAARIAKLVDEFAVPIRDAVTGWLKARKAEKEYDATKTLAGLAKKDRETAARLQKAEAQAKKEAEDKAKQNAKTQTASTGEPLTAEDVRILNQGPTHMGDGQGSTQDLIAAIRENRVTPEMQKSINEYNKALDKLPNHQGAVFRHTNLTPEQLARYKPGQPVTEDGYTCTTTNPAGTNGGVNNGTNVLENGNQKVEYQILSKTGKDIHDYGGTSDEIQFKDHTDFFVHNKYWSPEKNKWIIIMEEMPK